MIAFLAHADTLIHQIQSILPYAVLVRTHHSRTRYQNTLVDRDTLDASQSAAETSIAGGDSVLIYDDSASALRKMTRTNFVSVIFPCDPSLISHPPKSSSKL